MSYIARSKHEFLNHKATILNNKNQTFLTKKAFQPLTLVQKLSTIDCCTTYLLTNLQKEYD